MTKLFILLVFSVSTFALGKSPLETFDLSPEERNAVIDYCDPVGFDEVILKDGTRQRKYLHPSESAGLAESDEPPYDLLESRTGLGEDPLSKKARIFLGLMADGGAPRYGCDRVAVLYVAKFIKRYWPGSECCDQYPNSARLVRDFLRRTADDEVPLIVHARIEARKMLITETK
ncbi:MAG: hypothetical protein WCK49_09500 [Myxococcaceae bacterium]